MSRPDQGLRRLAARPWRTDGFGAALTTQLVNARHHVTALDFHEPSADVEVNLADPASIDMRSCQVDARPTPLSNTSGDALERVATA